MADKAAWVCAGNLALKFCNFANLAGLDPAEEEAIAIWEMGN